jgi:hypothetical protein
VVEVVALLVVALAHLAVELVLGLLAIQQER